MNGRLKIDEALTLDARRAVWLPQARLLAVADTHLGYAWVQRSRGLLIPVDVPDQTFGNLQALVADYRPERLAILGDVVHGARDVPGLAELLHAVVGLIPGGVTLVLGNHDRRLRSRLSAWGVEVECTAHLGVPGFDLVHGDRWPATMRTGVRRLSGHEHPAVFLGDAAGTGMKVPAFVVGRQGVVLPAFSAWAAGSVVGREKFMGAVAGDLEPDSLVACLGPRLLRLPLTTGKTSRGFEMEGRVIRVRRAPDGPA